METYNNPLADWAKNGYQGLKTWKSRRPPHKPQIVDYLRQSLVSIQDIAPHNETPTVTREAAAIPSGAGTLLDELRLPHWGLHGRATAYISAEEDAIRRRVFDHPDCK